MVSAKCLRVLVVVVLTVCLCLYLAQSVAKYREGRTGVDSRKEPLEASRFPSVVVCAGVPDFAPVSRAQSWIVKVKQDYLEEGGSGDIAT